MSNVLARNRKQTPLEYYNTALSIKKDIVLFVMNEKRVPKRWRVVHTFPMINALDDLIEHITRAYSETHSSLESLHRRDAYQSQAVADCRIICQKLVFIQETIETTDANRIGEFTKTLMKEYELLKAWRAQTLEEIRRKEKELNNSSKGDNSEEDSLTEVTNLNSLNISIDDVEVKSDLDSLDE